MTRRLAHLTYGLTMLVCGMLLLAFVYSAGFQHGKLRAERPVENDKVLADELRRAMERAFLDDATMRTDSIKDRVRACGPLRECE